MLSIPYALLSEGQRKMISSIHDHRVKTVLRFAKPFAETRPPKGRDSVGIIASTYNPENPLDEIFPEVKPTDPGKFGIFDPSGYLSYSKMKLPVDVGLAVTGTPDLWTPPGRAYFTEEIAVPVLHYNSVRHLSGWDVWMSLTPMEIWTQQSGIKAATGHVVIGGLGMGWLLRQIAKKPTVKSITVVEKDQRLLDWYGLKLCAATPKVDKVICADIYDVARNFDLKRTKFIIDIWPSSSGASFDKQLQQLRDDGAKVWAWCCARDPRPKWRQDDPRRRL